MTDKNLETENPYTAPISESPVADIKKQTHSIADEIRKIFVAWEKLRILFNVILVGLTLIMAFRETDPILTSPGFWIFAFQGAVLVNLCFFAGPIVESYMQWLGVRVNSLRILLFVLGTLFAALLVIVTLSSSAIPTPN